MAADGAPPPRLSQEASAFLDALDARKVQYRLTPEGFKTASKLTNDEAVRVGPLMAELAACLSGLPTCQRCKGIVRGTTYEVTWMDRVLPEREIFHAECMPQLTDKGKATMVDLRPRCNAFTFWQGPCRCIWCDNIATHPRDAEMPMTCAGCSRKTIRPWKEEAAA